MNVTCTETGELRFTSKIDDCIVKLFPTDQKALFKQLTPQGYKRRAIIERARQLGLSDQFIKWCAINNPDLKMRPCLGCGERFLSVGFQNRLCRRCRDRR